MDDVYHPLALRQAVPISKPYEYRSYTYINEKLGRWSCFVTGYSSSIDDALESVFFPLNLRSFSFFIASSPRVSCQENVHQKRQSRYRYRQTNCQ